MKLLLQVPLHGIAAFAGFWLMSGEVTAPPGKSKPVGDAAGMSVMPSLDVAQSVRPKIVAPEAGLSPENWPEEIAAISSMQLSDLPGALRRYLNCRFPDVRRRLLRLLFERWAVLDRPGALAALKGIPSPQMKAQALGAILKEWVKTDEAAAWQHIVSIHDDYVLQEEAIQSLLTLCADRSPANYVSWAKQLEDPFLRGKALDSIAHAWARKDPKAALEAAFTEADPFLRSQLFKLATPRDDSSLQFSQALDGILQLPDRAESVRVMSDWIPIFANIQPSAALKWLQQHASRPELQKASGVIGSVMAEQSKLVSDIRNAALSLPEGPIRDAFAANAAGAWASRGHPTLEAEQLLALSGPCIEREHAVISIEAHRKQR